MKVFKCSVYDSDSIHNLINQLQYYKGVEIEDKCRRVTQALSELGMRTIRECKALNEFGEFISESTMDFVVKNGYGTILIATQTGTIIAEWIGSEGQARVEVVDPLLMAEYGSGLKARPTQTLENGLSVGQGTFPNQTHATDPKGWWWKDLDGNWQHSTGIKPTMPMYYAMFDMFNEAEEIVKKAFRS